MLEKYIGNLVMQVCKLQEERGKIEQILLEISELDNEDVKKVFEKHKMAFS